MHSIKQEPVDYNETPEITCVTFQLDSENSLKETLPKKATLDDGNVQIQTKNGNQDDVICSVPRENQESHEGENQSHVTEASAPLESL